MAETTWWQEVINSPAFWLIMWLFLSAVIKEVDAFFSAANDAITSPFNLLREVMEDLRRAIDSLRGPVGRKNYEMSKAMQDVLQQIIDGLGYAASSLHMHTIRTISLVEQDENKRGWRIVGALISFAALGLFVYADMAQNANNLSSLFPQERIPSWLQNLVIPLLVGSVGTVAILSMIAGDIIGLTHFTPVDRTPRWFRSTIIALVLVTILFSVFIATAIALNRFQLIAPYLPEETRARIHSMAAQAQSLIIVPLLITTFLLLWGLVAIMIVYAAAIWFTSFIFQVGAFGTQVLQKAVALGAIASDAILKIVLYVLLLLPAGIGYLLGLIATILNKLLNGIATLIRLVLAPPQLIFAGVRWVYSQFAQK